MTSVMTTEKDAKTGAERRLANLRPFEKGVSQTHKFAQARERMLAEFIRDLERAGERVSEADRLLAERYVRLIKSKSSPQLNTALKIREVLIERYSGNKASAMTAFDRYVAELSAKKDAQE